MVYGASLCSTYDEIVDSVQQKKISARAGRDSARCLLTEIQSGNKVMTIDYKGDTNNLEYGFFPRVEHHIAANMNDLTRNRYSDVFKPICGRVREIYLDYCFSSDGYWYDKINDSFYQRSLPFLSSILDKDGIIVLPLQHYIFLKLVQHARTIARHLSIGLISLEMSKTLSLVKATDSINPVHMVEYFEKKTMQQKTLIAGVDFGQRLIKYCTPSIGSDVAVRAEVLYQKIKSGKDDCFIIMRPTQIDDIHRTTYLTLDAALIPSVS